MTFGDFSLSVLASWIANQIGKLRKFPKNEYAKREDIDNNYLPVCLTRSGATITIESFGNPDRVIAPMQIDLWSKKLVDMQSFLCSQEENKIEDIGLALGIQNFIIYRGKLLVGVRIKAIKHVFRTDSVIAKGAFNTGYKLLKENSDMEKIKEEVFQNLFNFISVHFTMSFVEEDSNTHKEIIKRTGQNNCIINFNGRKYIGIIFINKSRYYPRYEIGICRYIDISSINPPIEIIDAFGKDQFEDENYWIWISEGKIHFRSFSSGHFVPNSKNKNEITHKHAILVSNQYLIDHFGIKEKYVPLASDELLEVSEILNRSFASPARSVLECF